MIVTNASLHMDGESTTAAALHLHAWRSLKTIIYSSKADKTTRQVP